jgi:hypothetical protein
MGGILVMVDLPEIKIVRHADDDLFEPSQGNLLKISV